MKKGILTFIVTVLFSAFLSAQEAPLAQGQMQLNAGFGFSSWGLPVYVGLDYGVHPDISIGGELSFRSYSDNWNNSDYNHTVIGISANGNYHFNTLMEIPSNWDVYAGLNLGFYIYTSDKDYGGSNSSGLGLGAQIGGRYYWSENWGVNLEFGGGNAFSGGKVGITYKF